MNVSMPATQGKGTVVMHPLAGRCSRSKRMANVLGRAVVAAIAIVVRTDSTERRILTVLSPDREAVNEYRGRRNDRVP
jgi:hypothetical protein